MYDFSSKNTEATKHKDPLVCTTHSKEIAEEYGAEFYQNRSDSCMTAQNVSSHAMIEARELQLIKEKPFGEWEINAPTIFKTKGVIPADCTSGTMIEVAKVTGDFAQVKSRLSVERVVACASGKLGDPTKGITPRRPLLLGRGHGQRPRSLYCGVYRVQSLTTNSNEHKEKNRKQITRKTYIVGEQEKLLERSHTVSLCVRAQAWGFAVPCLDSAC